MARFELTACIDSAGTLREITWEYGNRADAMQAFMKTSRTMMTIDSGSPIEWAELTDTISRRRVARVEA